VKRQLPRIILSACFGMLIACSTPQATSSEVDPTVRGSEPAETTAVPPHPDSGRDRIELVIKDERFLMEISDDDRERTLGLSGRERLGRNEGMLFVYPEKKVLGYWMKDCLIDLEIVYVREDGRIMSMHRMKKEPPRGGEERLNHYEDRLPRYSSRYLVQYALEFTPGTIDRLGLKKGQVISLPAKQLQENVR
jgi:hypothetical protein